MLMRLFWPILISAVVGSSAAAGPRSLERAFETNTQNVSLPARLPSSIEARCCLHCPSIRIQIPETARFFVGKEQVSLQELREFALGKRFDMVIFYELDAPVARRIVVSALLPKKPATR